MTELVVILGDQLFEGSPGMPPDCPLFMREDAGLASRYHYHQQKLVLFFSAMRHFAASSSRRVIYETYQPDSRTFFESLKRTCEVEGIKKVWFYPPNDPDTFDLSQFDFDFSVLPDSPMFVTPRDEWQSYARSNKRRQMSDFYIWQRKRMNLLMDDAGEQQGGKWSFDGENQKKLLRSMRPPEVRYVEADAITSEVISLVERAFASHPGNARDFKYAVTHKGAEAWLQQFLNERLALFGDYEDAIPQRERTLFHSLLTPYLNCGLLTPQRVIEVTRELDVPINSKEGFLRQIIGWREFMFGMKDMYDGVPNFFGHERRMNATWYTASTGLPPVDEAIRRAHKHAYCHHIERLMILGAVMLMSEIHPEDVFKWFMEMFIDSAEWVMRPNVFGMSQYADGGLYATKPYICGSAYILKMSDWEKGDWCDIWDGLYWRFIERNRDCFAKNHRMSMMVKLSTQLKPDRKERIFNAAEAFISHVTQ